MSRRAGRNASVKIGTSIVAGMGNWTLDGYNVDLIDVTAFGNVDKVFDLGFGDAGTLTFNGNYDPDDPAGQQLLESYGSNKEELTDLFLYVDLTSYYTADMTTSSGPNNYALITKSRSIVMDATNVGKISFTAKLSGVWVLV
jgi:hypothetical protein